MYDVIQFVPIEHRGETSERSRRVMYNFGNKHDSTPGAPFRARRVWTRVDGLACWLWGWEQAQHLPARFSCAGFCRCCVGVGGLGRPVVDSLTERRDQQLTADTASLGRTKSLPESQTKMHQQLDPPLAHLQPSCHSLCTSKVRQSEPAQAAPAPRLGPHTNRLSQKPHRGLCHAFLASYT